MGRPPELTESEVLGTLREAADPPVMSARMVADKFDVSRPTAHKELRQLEESGEIRSAKIGRTTAYWTSGDSPTADELAEFEPPEEPPDDTVSNTETGSREKTGALSRLERFFLRFSLATLAFGVGGLLSALVGPLPVETTLAVASTALGMTFGVWAIIYWRARIERTLGNITAPLERRFESREPPMSGRL